MFCKRRSEYAKTAKENIGKHTFVVQLEEKLREASEKSEHVVEVRVPLGQLELFKFLSDENVQKLICNHFKNQGVAVEFEKVGFGEQAHLPKWLRIKNRAMKVTASFSQ